MPSLTDAYKAGKAHGADLSKVRAALAVIDGRDERTPTAVLYFADGTLAGATGARSRGERIRLARDLVR